MKTSIRTISILLSPILKKVFQNKSFFIPLAALFVFTFGATWDKEQDILQIFWVFNMNWLSHSTNSKQAFELYGVDIFVTIWVAWMVFFIPTKIFQHISKSYSVSQSLWLRFLPLQTIDLTAYRVAFLFIVVAIFGGLSIIWMSLFTLIYQLNWLTMLVPIIGLVAHILFSGMFIILLSSPRMPILTSSNMGLVFFALIFPLLLHAMGKGIAVQLDGFFPFSSPFAAKIMGRGAARPFVTTFAVGLIGCLLQLMIVYFNQQKLKKQLHETS